MKVRRLKKKQPPKKNRKSTITAARGGSVAVWGSTPLQTSLTHSAAYQSVPVATQRQLCILWSIHLFCLRGGSAGVKPIGTTRGDKGRVRNGGKSLSSLVTCLTQHTAKSALPPSPLAGTTPGMERRGKKNISQPGRYHRSPETWLLGICRCVKEESDVTAVANGQFKVCCRRCVQEAPA